MGEKTHLVDSAPLIAARLPYAWGEYTARFLVRLIITVTALFVFLVLAMLSGIPFGGGAKELFQLFHIGFVLLPLWTLSAFVPPMKTWDRPPVTPLTIVGGCMILHVWLCIHLFSTPKPKPEVVNRDAGIAVCKGDLKAISSPIAVDSLLIDTGFVDQFTLRDLLGRKGLRFVELRARTLKNFQRAESFGVAAFSGNQSTDFNVSRDIKIIRLSYATRGDPSCTGSQVLGLEDAIGSEPISPDACVRVELDQQSHASHVLKAVPAESNLSLIKWAVLEQTTGKTLAALTAGDAPEFPSHQGGGLENESKIIDGDLISCRSVHYSLMHLIYGPPRKSDERLSLGHRTITFDLETADLASSEAWEQQAAPEEVVTDFDSRHIAQSGPTWNEGYREAQRTGWGSYADYVIDFGTGDIIKAAPFKQPFQWQKIRGSRNGFMVARNKGHSTVALAHFGLDGRLLWKRQIVPDKPAAGYLRDFSLSGMEWDDNQVRLYGYRQNSHENSPGETSVLRIATPATARKHALPSN